MAFSGRVGRRRYIIAQIALVPLGSVCAAAFALAMANLSQTFSKDAVPQIVRGLVVSQSAARALIVVAVPVGLALLVANLSFTVRRLHDLGFSGWFLLLWFAFVLVWTGFSTDPHSTWSFALEAVLMMVPGQPAANRYGADPRPLADAGLPPPGGPIGG